MKQCIGTERSGRTETINKVQAATHALSTRDGVLHPLVVDITSNLIRQKHLVSASELQALMGWISPRAVEKARAAHRIFSMPFEGRHYFPAFFADSIYSRRHLMAVSRALDDLPGGAKLQFFVSRKCSLGGVTPLDAVAAGRLPQVLALAGAYAET